MDKIPEKVDKIPEIPDKDGDPEKVSSVSPENVKNCDANPTIHHKIGGNLPPISVSFGCILLNIATGGCHPDLPIVTQTCDLPNITKGNCTNNDSTCDYNNITTSSCNNSPDNDSKSTKCNTDCDL